MDHIDTCVIGAGVIGLAIARARALDGFETLVLERGARFGEGISSRNSEVIHAGIYYPPGSLKAKFCVRGKQLLYDYCTRRHVGHACLGKLIVATSQEEEGALEAIRERARLNGVDDLEYVSASTLAKVEPAVRGTLALRSPSTGVISSHDLMTSFLGDLQSAGGELATNISVESVLCDIAAASTGARFVIRCDINSASYEFSCSRLINSAGLGAQNLAARIAGLDPASIPELFLCKGSYFLLRGKNPFHHLIYPVPEPSGTGLGVHATIDLGGQVKFGPDVEYVDHEDYTVSEQRMDSTYQAIRRYFPGIKDYQLVPGYTGIRPKLQGPNDAPKDFMLDDETHHGIPGLIQLFGIESPGLTSSMAIAETVCERLNQQS